MITYTVTRTDDERQRSLIDVFLIAATINLSGDIDLAVVSDGQVEMYARVRFKLGSGGEVLQQRYWISPSYSFNQVMVLRQGEQEPLDMVFFAECLTYALGDLTPPLFQLVESRPGGPPRLLLSGAQNDRARLRLLQNAFHIYLLAYAERLV